VADGMLRTTSTKLSVMPFATAVVTGIGTEESRIDRSPLFTLNFPRVRGCKRATSTRDETNDPIRPITYLFSSLYAQVLKMNVKNLPGMVFVQTPHGTIVAGGTPDQDGALYAKACSVAAPIIQEIAKKHGAQIEQKLMLNDTRPRFGPRFEPAFYEQSGSFKKLVKDSVTLFLGTMPFNEASKKWNALFADLNDALKKGGCGDLLPFFELKSEYTEPKAALSRNQPHQPNVVRSS
jgi:hypothetical protein